MRIKPVVLVAFALGFGVTILTLQTTASHASLRGQAPGASPTGTVAAEAAPHAGPFAIQRPPPAAPAASDPPPPPPPPPPPARRAPTSSTAEIATSTRTSRWRAARRLSSGTSTWREGGRGGLDAPSQRPPSPA